MIGNYSEIVAWIRFVSLCLAVTPVKPVAHLLDGLTKKKMDTKDLGALLFLLSYAIVCESDKPASFTTY